jgi:hypothetical protein
MMAGFADDPQGIFPRWNYTEKRPKSKGKSSFFLKIQCLLINIYINNLRVSPPAAGKSAGEVSRTGLPWTLRTV